jgi:ribosomal protein L37AE/L43A
MVDMTNSINVIAYLLEKDYENKICVECKSPMPTHASINNAILMCGNCAEKHKELGYNISYIRELKSDWDQYLLTYLERGGNSRYIRLCKKYDLENMPIEQKLKTKIFEYYRLLVSKNLINIILI